MKLSAQVQRLVKKRLASSLLLFAICYLLFAITPVYAQSINQAPQNSYTAPNTNPDVPKNLHTYTQNVMIEVMSAVTCQLAGVDPTNPSGKCLGVDPKTGSIGFVEGGGGLIAIVGNQIAALYNPPIHTSNFITYMASNFGITHKAYARCLWGRCGFGQEGSVPAQPETSVAGTGFDSLKPLMGLWIKFRDIVYLLFVLVFIIVGVAIMLRVKIDPRTVMTIQNQIPKLIIGVLLVTFSIAIAGFLIDVMWVALYLIFGIFSGPGTHVQSFDPQNLVGSTPFGAVGGLGGIGGISSHAAGGIKGILSSLFDNTFGRVIASMVLGVLGGGAGALFGPIGIVVGAASGIITGGLAGGEAIGFIGGIIAFLIIAIALLWALLRLWFALLSAYVMILIDIVLAPFWIVAGLFPGSSIGFTAWLRSLVANLSVFPATLVLFLLGKTFIDSFAKGPASLSFNSTHFVPPFIGNPGDYKSFGAIIGLGIILTTPNIVKTLREALKAPKVDLSSIGAAVGVGAGVPISAARSIAAYYHEPIPGSGQRAGVWGVARSILKF